MEDFIEVVKNCEQILYRGFLSAKASDLSWLNKCCGCFCQLFNQLHKVIVFEAQSNETFIEECFLCVSQIVIGIKNMERILESEAVNGVVLGSLRQFFLDRIIVCLNRLKDLCDQLETRQTPTPEPFLTECFDTVLELLSPFCQFNEIDNVSERNATALLDVSKIRALIECIIAQTLTFANILGNKNPLTHMCQRVLRECKALQDECSLDERSPNEVDRRLKASILETAIYGLENLINDSLLRCLFETFTDLRKVSLQELKDNENVQDLMDSTIDRLMQIGGFAINFANNFKTTSNIKSCLASIESLESHLCHELLVKYDNSHFKILEKHWTEETTRLEKNIQQIIDSSAFSATFIEILEENISKLNSQFDIEIANDAILKSKILLEHFKLNLEEKQKLHDFNMMINECEAGLKIIETLDPKRLIKRFKILKTTVKRLRKSMNLPSIENKNVQKPDADPMKEILKITETGDEEVLLEEKYVEKGKSILYESCKRTGKKSFVDPSVSWKASKIIKEVSMTPKKALNRKMSLRRVALMKSKNIEDNLDVYSLQDKSLTLQITEILNELTNISTNIASSGARSEVQVLKDNKIRIHIIGDI